MIAAATGLAAATLSVSPVRVRLAGSASRIITVTNPGGSVATVTAATAGFAFDRHGKPAIAAHRQRWLRLHPQRLVLAPGEAAAVTVSSVVPRGARPGDHPAVVLFTTKPPGAPTIAVRVRIGVVVLIRVAGRIVHHLEVGPLRAHDRTLQATVANRGNVAELTRVRISLSRGGRVLARLRSARRTLLAHSQGVERLPYPRRVRGWVTATVEAGVVRRSFRIRL